MQAAPIVRWVGALLLVSLAAFPLARRIFPAFPDRGASFAPALALTVITLVAYWFGHVHYGTLTAVVALAVLLGLALLTARRERGWFTARREQGWSWPTLPSLRAVPSARSLAAHPVRAPAAVFLGTFGFMLAVRAVDPAVHPAGGEKFLDYGLLKSILRADRLPPEDMWFAGEPIRYYYAGPLLIATLSKLAGVPARFAYNLGLATGYATLLTGAYGLAAAVADARDRTPRTAGLLAVFFVGFAGTLATPARLLLAKLPRDVALTYGRFLLSGIRKTPAKSLDAIAWDAWSYWLGRYVIPDTIEVFPLWSYLNGDLHAHVLATPFLVLAAAVCFAIYRGAGRRRLALLLGVLPAVAGLLALISTWSFPTAGGLAFLALALADRHPAAGFPPRVRRPLLAGTVRRELSRHLLAGLGALAVGVVGFAWASPYLLFHTPVNRGVGFFPPRSPLGPLVLVYGVFVLVFTVFLWRRRPASSALPAGASHPRLAATGAAVALFAALAGLVVTDLAAVALVGPLLVGGWWATRRRDAGYVGLLVVAGAGLLLAVEFAYARVWPFDPNAPRWNTVYKVSMQLWVIWGIGGGTALGALVDRARPLARLRRLVVPSQEAEARDALPALALLALLVPAGTFGAAALVQHAHSAPRVDDPTLDATDFVEIYHPAEAEAIDWLDAREGTPTLVAHPGEPMYTWVSAPSSLTGVPAVVGWRHEAGYRGRDAYRTRARDVAFIYQADWPSAAILLDKYDVQYVYVGPVEREGYDVRGFAGHTGVDVAFENEAVTIYEVDAERACEATDVYCPSG